MSVIDDITDVRKCSMQENIPIHNFSFTPNNDLATAYPMTIKQTQGVVVKFAIMIH